MCSLGARLFANTLSGHSLRFLLKPIFKELFCVPACRPLVAKLSKGARIFRAAFGEVAIEELTAGEAGWGLIYLAVAGVAISGIAAVGMSAVAYFHTTPTIPTECVEAVGVEWEKSLPPQLPADEALAAAQNQDSPAQELLAGLGPEQRDEAIVSLQNEFWVDVEEQYRLDDEQYWVDKECGMSGGSTPIHAAYNNMGDGVGITSYYAPSEYSSPSAFFHSRLDSNPL